LISSRSAIDFRDFVSWVRQFHQTDNAKVGAWDLPPAVD